MNNAIILLVVAMAILAVAAATVVFYRALTALKEANPKGHPEMLEVRKDLPLGVPTSQGLIDLARQQKPTWLYQETKDWQA